MSLYAIGDLSKDKTDALKLFAQYCQNDDNQTLADRKGFNLHNDYKSQPNGLDGAGYADSDESCLTRTEGVFVAGDCRKKSVRQLTTAVADGSVAALAACSYLDR